MKGVGDGVAILGPSRFSSVNVAKGVMELVRADFGPKPAFGVGFVGERPRSRAFDAKLDAALRALGKAGVSGMPKDSLQKRRSHDSRCRAQRATIFQSSQAAMQAATATKMMIYSVAPTFVKMETCNPRRRNGVLTFEITNASGYAYIKEPVSCSADDPGAGRSAKFSWKAGSRFFFTSVPDAS